MKPQWRTFCLKTYSFFWLSLVVVATLSVGFESVSAQEPDARLFSSPCKSPAGETSCYPIWVSEENARQFCDDAGYFEADFIPCQCGHTCGSGQSDYVEWMSSAWQLRRSDDGQCHAIIGSITCSQQDPARRFVSQKVFLDIPTRLIGGQKAEVTLQIRNLGSETWTPTGVSLKSTTTPPTLWGPNTKIELLHKIEPGQTATFVFNVTAPPNAGDYLAQWRMHYEQSDSSIGFGESVVTSNIVVLPSVETTRLTDICREAPPTPGCLPVTAIQVNADRLCVEEGYAVAQWFESCGDACVTQELQTGYNSSLEAWISHPVAIPSSAGLTEVICERPVPHLDEAKDFPSAIFLPPTSPHQGSPSQDPWSQQISPIPPPEEISSLLPAPPQPVSGLPPVSTPSDYTPFNALPVLPSDSGAYDPELTPPATGPAVSTRGKATVGLKGAANYEIDLWIPTGRGNVAPRLALQYSHRAANIGVGVGFSLSPAAVITRCPKHFTKEDGRTPIAFNEWDDFCLSGRRLVRLEPTVTSPQEYRFEQDNGTLVRAYRTGTEVTSFIVFDGDGSKQIYGQSLTNNTGYIIRVSEATFRPAWPGPQYMPQGGPIVAWYLQEVADNSGNTAHYHYQDMIPATGVDNGVEPRLTSIRYSGFEHQTGAGEPYTIRFLWEDKATHAQAFADHLDAGQRRDTYGHYFRDGAHLRNRFLLAAVEVDFEDTMIRRYPLTYIKSPTTGRALLTKLETCDKHNKCALEAEFEYESLPNRSEFNELQPPTAKIPVRYDARARIPYSYHPSPLSLPQSYPKSLRDTIEVGRADINGDSYEDLWYTRRPSSERRELIVVFGKDPYTEDSVDCPTGIEQSLTNVDSEVDNNPISPFHSRACLWYTSQMPFIVKSVDLNLDGLSDFAVTNFEDGWQAILTARNGEGFEPSNAVQISHDSSSSDLFVDLNGDGRMDLLSCRLCPTCSVTRFFTPYYFNDESSCVTNEGNICVDSFVGEEQIPIECGPSKAVHLADLNSDGRPDFISAEQLWIMGESLVRSGINGIRGIGDFNGDGNSDIFAATTNDEGATNDARVLLGDGFGNFFSQIRLGDLIADGVGEGPVIVLDLDNDGLADVLSGQPSAYTLLGPQVISFTPYLSRDGVPGSVGKLSIYGTNRDWFGADPSVSGFASTSLTDMTFGDFDGDGYSDHVHNVGADLDYPIRISSQRQDGGRDVVERIYETHHAEPIYSFIYKRLNEDGVYSILDCQDAHPSVCVSPQGDLTVVSSLHISTLEGLPPEEQSYQYHDGVASIQGLGFLGFKRSVQRNTLRNQTIIHYQEFGEPNDISQYRDAYVRQKTIITEVNEDASNERSLHISKTIYSQTTRQPVDAAYYQTGSKRKISIEEYIAKSEYCEGAFQAYWDALNTATRPESPCDTTSLQSKSVLQYSDKWSHKIDNYGNVLEEIVFYGKSPDCDRDVTTIVYEPPLLDNWLIHRTRRREVSSVRNGMSGTRVERFSWDSNGRVVTRHTRNENDPLAAATSYFYDLYGNTVRERKCGLSLGERRCREVVTLYDEIYSQLPTDIFYRATDSNEVDQSIPTGPVPDALHEEVRYHPWFQEEIFRREPSGATVKSVFDSLGRIVLTSHTGGNTQRIEYAPSTTGLYSIRAIDETGVTRTEHRDWLNRIDWVITKSTSGKNIAQKTLYDALGRAWALSLPSEVSSDSDLPDETPFAYVRTTYDQLDRPIAKVDTRGFAERYRYEPSTNPSGSNAGIGTDTVFISSRGLESRTTIDTHGNIVSRTDPKGQKTAYEYGPFDTPFRVTDTAGRQRISLMDAYGFRMGLWDEDAGLEWYSPNSFGEIEQIIDSSDIHTTIGRDALGRTVWVGRRDQGEVNSTPRYSIISYVKDGLGIGQLESQIGPDGHGEAFSYDEVGRVAAYSTFIGDDVYTFDYRYDDIGRKAEVVYPSTSGIVPGEVDRPEAISRRLWIHYDYKNGGLSKVSDGQEILWEFVDERFSHQNSWGDVTSYERVFRQGAGEYSTWTRTAYDDVNRVNAQHVYANINGSAENSRSRLIVRRYDYDADHALVNRVDEFKGQKESIVYDELKPCTLRLRHDKRDSCRGAGSGSLGLKRNRAASCVPHCALSADWPISNSRGKLLATFLCEHSSCRRWDRLRYTNRCP